MEHDRKQFFKEHESDDVNGFTILEADGESEEYHIAEKWEREDEEGAWMDYWIAASDLQERVEQEYCEPAAEVTDDQFEAICKKVDHSKVRVEA